MSDLKHLPIDDAQRLALHNEIHARPSARIRLPALIVYVAVLNEGISREDELAQLRKLPGQAALDRSQLNDNFLRLRYPDFTLKWERHTEFTRYSIVQTLQSDVRSSLVVSSDWLQTIPGRTITAINLVMVTSEQEDAQALIAKGQSEWFAGRTIVASRISDGHSCAMTDFHVGSNGFEQILVYCNPRVTQTRAGRLSQRLLELETYRIMALRGLPVAKDLTSMLGETEQALAHITARLEEKAGSDQNLLDTLVSLAARVERAIAQHNYRFSATSAYHNLVEQRLVELRESEVAGTQTIGQFLNRRMSPAMATVHAAHDRLTSLSQRVSRTSALLRTRVDIATEGQNQELLAKLTRGQAMQLRLQTTVEGLSIAAIAYYVVSLVHYVGEALHGAGLPLNPNILAGMSVPVVLWGVWRITRRIHAKFADADEPHI